MRWANYFHFRLFQFLHGFGLVLGPYLRIDLLRMGHRIRNDLLQIRRKFIPGIEIHHDKSGDLEVSWQHQIFR